MTLLARSAALTGFVPLVRSYGLDPLDLAKEARVPTQALFESDLQIAATSVAQLLELAARTGAEDFGLRLADTRGYPTPGQSPCWRACNLRCARCSMFSLAISG